MTTVTLNMTQIQEAHQQMLWLRLLAEQQTGYTLMVLLLVNVVGSAGIAPPSAGMVAAKLGLAGATVTDLLDRAQRYGLVVRELSPEDRRCWLIRLKEKGKALYESLN